MVKNFRQQQGAALAMTLLALSLMLVLMLAINKLVINQQRSAANYVDYALARNYANSALLNAENRVLNFDSAANLEAQVGVLARYNQLSSGSFNIESSGQTCNSGLNNNRSGWCYQSLGASGNYAQNQLFRPWLLTSANSVRPCNSYTIAPGSNVPLIDDSTSRFSVVFATGDNSICAQPRYIIEPINLDFRGRFESDSNFDYGRLTQPVAVTTNLYRRPRSGGNPDIPSSRLYRITVRAFGKNGDTRVTLQEYIAVRQSGNTSQRIIPIATYWLK